MTASSADRTSTRSYDEIFSQLNSRSNVDLVATSARITRAAEAMRVVSDQVDRLSAMHIVTIPSR
jgi:PBP1b-binding outer membrane lipoprotein LpoB